MKDKCPVEMLDELFKGIGTDPKDQFVKWLDGRTASSIEYARYLDKLIEMEDEDEEDDSKR